MIDDFYDCRVYFAAGLALQDFLNIPLSLSTFLGGILIFYAFGCI